MISRRVKSLSIPLPCAALITKLVRPDMMPFACNIAISLVDISICNIEASEKANCAIAILNAIDLFDVDFSPQISALLHYALQLLPEISSQFCNSTMSRLSQERIWSWLLDVCLVQAGLRKDAAGSIQPGLSAERVGRLTAKKEGWFMPYLSQVRLHQTGKFYIIMFSYFFPD